MNICNLCLCAIKDAPGRLPVCKSCYEQLQSLPPAMRMQRALEVMRNQNSRETAETLRGVLAQLEELIAKSKRVAQFSDELN